MKSLETNLVRNFPVRERQPAGGKISNRSELPLRSQAQPVATKKILLVDDDPGVRELLGRVLEWENYRVALARNGREAVSSYRVLPPDLVLLDLNMPLMDGWSAFRLINLVDPLRPIIVITARQNQYAQANQLGADALMEKPLNLTLLLETIRRLLAETDAERTRRLTNPDFQTALLEARADSSSSHDAT